MKPVDYALDYLKHGFSVIPCRPDKKPLVAWTEYQKQRTPEDGIRGWWTARPDANIGLVTGAISNLLVIDCDTEEAWAWLQERILNLSFPTAQTPRGGHHAYFTYPADSGLTIGADVHPEIKGLDFRGEGGYVLAPPSTNGNGGAYRWLDGLSIFDVEPPPAPSRLISILSNSLYALGSKEKEVKNGQTSQNQSKIFDLGRRDNDLFHVANCLVKGGMKEGEIEEVLTVITNTWGEHDPKWVRTKLESALNRADRRERNLSEDFKIWLEVNPGQFQVKESQKELGLVNSSQFHLLNVIIANCVKEGVLERVGNRRGWYRTVEQNCEEIDFLNAPDAEFPIDLPLGLSSQSIIYPGSVIIVAGSKSAGKTAIALDVVKRNMHQHKVEYITSELWDTELKKRLQFHQDLRLKEWRFKALRMNKPPGDFVDGSRKLYVFDYLEQTGEKSYEIAGPIKAVHDKLKDGVAVICLQKKPGVDEARGGQYTLDKARLYIALDRLDKGNRAKIVDCKAFRGSENPRGLVREFKLIGGAIFRPEGEWK